MTIDDEAVALAEKLWPERYVGDLTTAEWRRVYDRLHHICATHPAAEDDPACVAGLGCRSLCGRDISGEVFADGPLPGEQACRVCAEMDT